MGRTLQRSGLIKCLCWACSSFSILSSSCATHPGTARHLTSSLSFATFAWAFASWTWAVIHLVCWLSNTICPRCAVELLLCITAINMGGTGEHQRKEVVCVTGTPTMLLLSAFYGKTPLASLEPHHTVTLKHD